MTLQEAALLSLLRAYCELENEDLYDRFAEHVVECEYCENKPKFIQILKKFIDAGYLYATARSTRITELGHRAYMEYFHRKAV